jgi:hypothetical protein
VLGNIVHYDDPAIAGTFGIPGCVSINFTEFQNSGGGYLAVGWRYQLPYTCSDATIKGRAEILADDVMYNVNEELAPVLYKGALFTVRINLLTKPVRATKVRSTACVSRAALLGRLASG